MDACDTASSRPCRPPSCSPADARRTRAANGSPDADSDIDLLVVHDDTAPSSELRGHADDLATTVEALTGNDAQMVLMPLPELRERAQASHDLLNELRRDAILLHGKSLAELGLVREALQ